jgi:hypothetical protein
MEFIQGLFARQITMEAFIAYSLLFGISIYYWKEIWLAACGGNGKPQPDELLKLASFYFICSHYIEHQFRGAPFDLEMAMVFVGIVGVLKMPEIFNKGKKEEINDIPRG